MLKRLHIKNVKTWGSQLWDTGIDLAPITLFLGPNSAGKTSLLQMPLLLKQTFESSDRNLSLNLGGQKDDLIDMGTFKSVVHENDLKREIGLKIIMDDPDSVTRSEYEYQGQFVDYKGQVEIQRLDLRCDERKFVADRTKNGGYLLEAPEYEPKKINGRLDARRSFKPERSLSFSPDALKEIGALSGEVQDLSFKIRNAIRKATYLGPLREKPERSYEWNGGDPGDIGQRGERAIHAMLSRFRQKAKKNDPESGEWLVNQVSEWLSILGVADGMELEQQGKSRHYELIIKRGLRLDNIMDVGFGISQVMPMLVLAHYVAHGTTIIAEQPEIHLHPLAQVGLAELMVKTSRERKVQYIAETHSEHLFRRLQTLIAEGKLSTDECRLYFVDKEENGTLLRHLELDEFGRVSNWPKNFFGDVVGETERQAKGMLGRMAVQKGKAKRG